MPKIEELKERLEREFEEDRRKIISAAIEDAQRYKKDENGVYWFKTSGGYTILYYWEELPAAVRAVLEVTGENQ